MNYYSTENGVVIENIKEFNIFNTFECGQCFRWNRIGEFSYIGVVRDKVIIVSQNSDVVTLKGITLSDFEDYFIDYFDLKLDYCKIKQELSKINETLRLACEYSSGIRILRQEPWETLCSFIISQNNNIPRIKSIIEKLCQNYGKKIYNNFFTFPAPEILANVAAEDFRALGCGFRDKYILDAAKKVASRLVDLDKLHILPIDEARRELIKIKGVGPKVAECVLLYGIHRLEAFPIDVWMKKALAVLFNGYLPGYFGAYAGIAQQYIFHYSRMNSKQLF